MKDAKREKFPFYCYRDFQQSFNWFLIVEVPSIVIQRLRQSCTVAQNNDAMNNNKNNKNNI